MAWSLQSELTKLTSCEDLGSALLKLDLIEQLDEEFQISGESPEWVRGGAETYIYRFTLERPTRAATHLLLKACVAFSPIGSVEAILSQWVSRRELLQRAGVGTPRLYFAGQGLVLEEYISYSFPEAVQKNEGAQLNLVQALAATAAGLYRLGFKPVSLTPDLRSRGSDVVVVDFGADLGPPGAAPDEDYFPKLISREIQALFPSALGPLGAQFRMHWPHHSEPFN
jgi:hypothetical protein